MAESKHRVSDTHTISFRLEAEGFEKLQQEASNQGISINSLINHIIKNYFEWHIFEPKIGFVPILKPVVEKVFTTISEEQIAQIAASTANQESENAIYFMKGTIELIFVYCCMLPGMLYRDKISLFLALYLLLLSHYS
jgi:hypothetical protein